MEGLFLQILEMACDEYVIRRFDGETKKDYSMTLLSLAQEQQGVPLTIVYGNDTAEFLLSKTVTVPEINAGEIIGQLQDAQVLGADTTLLRMEIGSDGCMILDFNEAFGQQLGMYGSSGEYLMVGSTVNTFLTAFPECDRVRILVEGEPCSYGQMDYSQPFERFANVETTILTSIKIEGQEQEIEMSRIAATSGFAINYDKERFELKEEVSGMTSFLAKAGSLTARQAG